MRIDLAAAPAFAFQVRSSEIVYPGFAREYRSDHAEGKFYVGKEELVGPTLIIQPFRYGWFTQTRFEIYERQPWFDIAFVDPDGVVGTIGLRKESASNLAEWFLVLERGKDGRRVLPEAVKLHLGFADRQSIEDNHFFVCKVLRMEWATEQEFKRLSEFLASVPVLLPGEVFGE